MLDETLATDPLTYAFPRWKIGLLGMAGLFVITGLVLRGVESEPATELARSEFVPSAPHPGSSLVGESPSGTAIILPGETDDRPPEALGSDRTVDSAGTPWSPAFLRGGFGFFVGFCVGYSVRMFLKLASAVVGFQLLLLVLFANLGWIDLRWDIMHFQLGGLFSNLGDQLSSFETLIRGTLPSAGLAGVGLYTGLRRR